MKTMATQSDQAHTAALARNLLGPKVFVAVTDPRARYGGLRPEETPAMTGAVPKRLLEFTAGRAAIRQAMKALGHPATAVPQGDDRAPVWPDGLAGGMTHSSTACIAALARTGQIRSIGLDLEDDSGLDADLLDVVCTLSERAWIAAQPIANRALLAKLIFSAKECAYKCQYPISQTLFGFETLEITPDLDTGQFEATFVTSVAPFAAGTCLHGRFSISGGSILTAMTLGSGSEFQ
jgi:4'-phosphopantetheinyl transferase EntD